MKKITYILVAILILTISFEPLSNIYYENKRIKNEKYLAEYLSDKSFKRSYVKSLPKKLRPDLKNYHDFLMTRDPNTNSVPSERVLDAIKLRDAKLNSRSYLNRQTEINWTERGPSKQAGRTRALMLDGNFSSNNKVWAAGVSGGLWSITNIENEELVYGSPYLEHHGIIIASNSKIYHKEICAQVKDIVQKYEIYP